jgi:two-component system invasion response regulator UvrY
VHTDGVRTEAGAAEVTVLVVDDQRPLRHAIRSVLRHLEGFTFAGEAETGERSVELVADLRPDLVLMDINLPGMSGIDATRRILDATPGTVVFLCSTYGRNDLPPSVTTSGAAAYIHKEELTADLLRELWAAHRPA